ncbi:amidohydrolase [Falsihalocynthiibacter sp. BN13B15]|uniref:amidohydrolase n=1 Tax=Falsihalocynthiibacter sp. BN13B15 TaxID=3240871 RepID=UPI00350E96A1
MSANLNWVRDLRHALHVIAEVSGQEHKTSALIAQELKRFAPDKILKSVGGQGVIALFHGAQAGPTIGFRAELDALPIYELSDISYRSENDGVAHLCGHDGHMSMVLALAEELSKQRPKSGTVALIFQPAEETGQGAKALVQDPKFAALKLDYLFSLHNAPGQDVGKIQIPATAANCASRGLKIMLTGKTSHAAAPHDGLSPMPTVARLMPALAALAYPSGGVQSPDFSLVTLTHATLGKPTFGIAPGYAEIWATLRSRSDAAMENLCQQAETLATQAAAEVGLELEFSYHDVFDACENHPQAVNLLKKSLRKAQIPFEIAQQPQLWSEDFGQYSQSAHTAMFWLGSGTDQPQLHTPTYDFPDEILPVGTGAFLAVIREYLG